MFVTQLVTVTSKVSSNFSQQLNNDDIGRTEKLATDLILLRSLGEATGK